MDDYIKNKFEYIRALSKAAYNLKCSNCPNRYEKPYGCDDGGRDCMIILNKVFKRIFQECTEVLDGGV